MRYHASIYTPRETAERPTDIAMLLYTWMLLALTWVSVQPMAANATPIDPKAGLYVMDTHTLDDDEEEDEDVGDDELLQPAVVAQVAKFLATQYAKAKVAEAAWNAARKTKTVQNAKKWILNRVKKW